MPSLIDEGESGKAAFRRLLLAKELYLHALEHSQRTSALDKMIAVHNWHNAAEIVLKAIIQHFSIQDDILEKAQRKRFQDVSFPQLIAGISDSKKLATKASLPYARELQTLNDYRNQVQHDAFEPSADLIERCRVWMRGFMEQVYLGYFGIDFSKVSRVDYIADQTIKALLRVAQESVQLGNFRLGVLWASIAFDWGIEPQFEIESGFLHVFIDEVLEQDEDYSDDLLLFFHEIANRASSIEKRVYFMERGLGVAEYARLTEAKAIVQLKDNRIGVRWPKIEPNVDTTIDLIDIVTGVTLSLQDANESPNMPEEAKSLVSVLLEHPDQVLDRAIDIDKLELADKLSWLLHGRGNDTTQS